MKHTVVDGLTFYPPIEHFLTLDIFRRLFGGLFSKSLFAGKCCRQWLKFRKNCLIGSNQWMLLHFPTRHAMLHKPNTYKWLLYYSIESAALFYNEINFLNILYKCIETQSPPSLAVNNKGGFRNFRQNFMTSPRTSSCAMNKFSSEYRMTASLIW